MSIDRMACPACGSAVPNDAQVCDICGEDLTLRNEAPEKAPSPAKESSGGSVRQATSSAAANPLFCTSCGAANEQSDSFCNACGSQLRKAQVRRTAKKAPGKKPAAAISFSTTQWIVICVASFILGGVMVAVLTPSGGPGVTTEAQPPAENQQAGESKRPTLAQINLARDEAEANPSDMALQLKYANLLHDAMMLDQAIAQYKLYLASVPDNVDAQVDLGVCYFEQQKYPEAIAAMEAGVRVDPRHQLGNYNLGIVNLNAGNVEKAREWLTKARDLNPGTPYGQNAERLLKEHAGQPAQ